MFFFGDNLGFKEWDYNDFESEYECFCVLEVLFFIEVIIFSSNFLGIVFRVLVRDLISCKNLLYLGKFKVFY